MKKLPLLISILALIISCITLTRTFPSNTPVQFDYLGILIGILAFLTTVLLAWQLINYLSFEEKLNKKIEKAQDIIYKKNREYMEGILDYSEAFAVIAKVNLTKENYAQIYRNCISALNKFCNYFYNYDESAEENIQRCLSGMEMSVENFELLEKTSERCFFNQFILNDFQSFEFKEDEDFMKYKMNILSYLSDNHYNDLINSFRKIEQRRFDVLDRFKKKRILDESKRMEERKRKIENKSNDNPSLPD